MRNQNSGPFPILVGVLMTLLCLAMAGASIYFGRMFIPTPRPPVPDNLPASLDEVKKTCADGECIQGCFRHAAEAVGYEQYPPIMDSAYESGLVSYEVQADQLLNPSYPPISSKLVVYQRNSKAHHRIWNYFTRLIPAAHRPGLGEFVIYSGGESGAQFSTAEDGGWILRVNVLDATDPEFLTHALIHEYGHFLTLNPEQQAPLEAGTDCPQEPLYGCPARESYLNRFFEAYWTDLFPEWMSMKGAVDYDRMLMNFYQQHSDEFVSEYAATEPVEDIAETWTAFILEPEPANDSVASRKVLSLYAYPELVELRYEIITNLCTYQP